MQDTHQDAPRRVGLRWVAGAVGLIVAVAAAFALAPSSSANTTVTAQLSLTGVTTQGNILGGTTVGIHPGDSIDFKAAALPTAGLDNIPSLGPLLNDLVTSLLHTQYQVVLHRPAGFPGGSGDVALGGPTTGVCKGAPSLPVNFPNKGTFSFTWSVQYVLPGLLGCSKTGLNKADLNLLKGIGVALNVGNQWVGQIVVATNPPPPGISIQLPGVSLAPSVTGIGQLPTISVPGVVVPTIPINVSSILSLPGGGGTSGSGGGSTPPGGGTSTGVECVPCSVVPSVGLGGGFGGPGPDAGGVTRIGDNLHEQVVPPGGPSATKTPGPVTNTSTEKNVSLPVNHAPGAQVPVLLAIIAIIALALVTATYARLYLLRREA